MCNQNINNCGCQECTSSNNLCYTGPTLPNSGIENKDTLTVAVQKLDNVFTTNSKYKVYTALLNQSGENAPTAIILENTLGQVPTFSYNTVGNYDINVTGNIFTNNKTFVSITAGATNEDMTLKASALVSNSVSITRHSSGVPADGSITNASIEIRVYN